MDDGTRNSVIYAYVRIVRIGVLVFKSVVGLNDVMWSMHINSLVTVYEGVRRYA